MTLTEDERRVLGALAHASEDFGCFGFHPLSQATGIPVPQVRAACRSLTDKKLAEFHQTLWSEDGEMCGAGYGATKAARDLAAKDNSIPYIEA